MHDESNRKKSEKQIAFHGSKQETGQTASDPDEDASLEQLAMLIRKFGRWNPNRGRSNFPRNSPRNPPFNQKEQEEDGKKKGIQCFECSGFGHIQQECPNYLKKQRQTFSSTWSDDDDEEETEKSHCAFTSRKETTRWGDLDHESISEDEFAIQHQFDADTAAQLEIVQEKWMDLIKVNKLLVLQAHGCILMNISCWLSFGQGRISVE